MGFLLSKTWPFWLIAALLAALIAWLLCRRRHVAHAALSSRAGSADLALLRTREAELERVAADRASYREEVAILRPKAAAHDELVAQLAALRAGSVPLGEHQARVDHLNDQVATLQGRLAARSDGPPERPAQLVDLTEAAGVFGFAVAADDLTVVEGIGPKISGLLHTAGIRTWRELAGTPEIRLREILAAAGPRYLVHDPRTWPKQAALLADGHWAPFKSWTDQLDGGRIIE